MGHHPRKFETKTSLENLVIFLFRISKVLSWKIVKVTIFGNFTPPPKRIKLTINNLINLINLEIYVKSTSPHV